MHQSSILALTVFAIASVAPAQAVSGHFNMNPAPPGATVSFTGTNATGGTVILASQCTFYRIRQGSQTGPIVAPSSGCLQIPGIIPPGGTFFFSWNQRDGSGAQVPAGRYWFEIIAWEPGYTNQLVDWFCLSIRSQNEPALIENTPARIGQVAQMSIAAAGEPGALYVAGFSFSSNNPITVLGHETCLSQPVLVGAVANGIGFLDGNGNAANLAVNIPNIPGLVGVGYHVQALLSSSVQITLTNDLSFTILP